MGRQSWWLVLVVVLNLVTAADAAGWRSGGRVVANGSTAVTTRRATLVLPGRVGGVTSPAPWYRSGPETICSKGTLEELSEYDRQFWFTTDDPRYAGMRCITIQ